MAYQTYQAEAIVLRSGNLREANRYYYLLTREFGVIRATAQAVRKEASKLRYSLQELSFVEVALVRGREWRIVSARDPEHWWGLFLREPEKLRLLARLAALAARLSPGESANAYLFDTFLSGARALKTLRVESDLFAQELLLVGRILHGLGYLPLRAEYSLLLSGVECEKEHLRAATEHKKALLADINTALRASQL